MARDAVRIMRLGLAGLLVIGSVASAQYGTVEGTLTYDGEAITIRHVTIHEQEHSFEEGQTAYLLTLSENEIPYLEVDDTCPGPYGNRALQIELDQEGETYSRNFCFEGGNSSGQEYEIELDSFGPREYAGRLAAEFDVFDKPVAFDLRFSAPLPEELPGEALPAGGGEPGAAYIAWTKAVKTGELEQIKPLLPPDRLSELESLSPEEVKEGLEFLQMMAPESVEVLGGRQVEGTAYLEVEAVMEGESTKGEVKLERMDGVWVAVKESWSG